MNVMQRLYYIALGLKAASTKDAFLQTMKAPDSLIEYK